MDIDDNASITSTVENEVDSDFEWPVKKILAEGQIKGQTVYLIEWEDYPLGEATWEPPEHFRGSLLEDWAETKQKQQEGKIPKFFIDEWRTAITQRFRDKYARHEMRNRERQRRGLEIEHFDRTLEDMIAEINATPDDQPKATRDSAHQSPNADAPQPAPQPHEFSEERSHRSSVDDLFSDFDSKMEVEASSGYCDFVNEEDVTTPKPCADPVPVEDASTTHVTSLRPEGTQQLLAGIVIESARTTPSGNILTSQEPDVSLVKDMPDVEFDLDSDAMDIDDTSVEASPTTPSYPTLDKSATKSANVPDISDSLSTSSVIQPFPKPSMAAEVFSHQEGNCENIEQKNQKYVTSTPPARPVQSGKRVSFSVLAPVKERHSSKAEASLFVPDRSHKQSSSAPNPMPGILTRPESKSAEGDQIRHCDNAGESLLKACVIGPIKLTCSFQVSSRPADSQTRLFETIKELEVFHFTHICSAQDFLRQLRATELSSGLWETGTACPQFQLDAIQLASILDCLHSSSFGLLYHGVGLCLVIYPSKSSDWQQNPLPASPPLAGKLLQYLAFVPASTFQVSDMSLNFDLHYSSGISIFDKQLYHKLLPIIDQFDKTQPVLDSFFLMFPPSAKPEEDLLCRWLRVFNKNCEIRSCDVSGHWAKFVDGSRGAVILHQDSISILHRLPRFSKLLHSRNEDYNFWIFRLPFRSPVSEMQPMHEYMEQVGIALDRAFPPGVAVMATPSFFISQPMQAYNMLKWIWQNFSSEAPVYRHGKLVVCHDLDKWLLSLTLEKSETALDVRESKQILDIRMKTVMLVRKLLEQDLEDVTSPVVFAPVYIDGNDEQSLVNWFGWWSVSQVDKFRKFSVICSDNEDDGRLSRYIKRSALRELFSKFSGLQGTAEDAERATLVHDDTPQCLSTFIKGVSNDAHASSWNPLVICPWPVDQHEGNSRYGDASQWVSFFAEKHIVRAISGKTPRGGKNTQLGFFYIAENVQVATHLRAGQRAHPWVAFVRPMELHQKPWKHSELLIWDYRLRDMARQSPTMSESDLSPSQRDLVAEVARQYAKINLPLRKIWAGGFKASKAYSCSLDITLDWMKAVVANVKNWLPLSHEDLLNRRWTLVRRRNLPSRSPSPTAAPSDSADTNDHEAPEEAQRILFNPPNISSGNPEPYRNRLYQWAMAARVAKESEYTYMPTLEWYREQQQSGRGFEHIRVWSWKAFFEHYKIDDPES
ncbi:hypothetical protein LLEC1_01800 [Akanthomyces lecanii]|uniref:Chromo domain-containing protein n=1 Tax=Cordyceps confragosa TaxID=2714763 RepID=A0A179I0K9_CORDF|nr:hypothetical protein LLEC1_01800 [Akanthomyces lecanii]